MSITNFPTGADVFPVRLPGTGVVYTAGSPTVTISASDAARLVAQLAANGAPAVSATNPFQFTMFRAAYYNGTFQDPAKVANYTATGVNTSTGVLSGVTYVGGSGADQSFSAGDYLASTIQFRTVLLLAVAINAVELNKLGVTGDASLTTITGGRTGETPLDQATRLLWTANVMEFGAVGDLSANDRPAFARGIASLADGGVLEVPPGQYRFDENLLITKSIIIRACNPNTVCAAPFGDEQWEAPNVVMGATIVANFTTGEVITFSNLTKFLMSGVYGLAVVGKGTGSQTTTGIMVYNSVNVRISSVLLANLGVGIGTSDSEDGGTYDCILRGCAKGIYAIGTSNVNTHLNLKVSACTIGAHIVGSQEHKFINCSFQGIIQTGVLIRSNSVFCSFHGGHFESVSMTGHAIDSDSTWTSVDGTSFNTPADTLRMVGGRTSLKGITSQKLVLNGSGNHIANCSFVELERDADAIAQTIWEDFVHAFRPAVDVYLEPGKKLDFNGGDGTQTMGRRTSDGYIVLTSYTPISIYSGDGVTFVCSLNSGGDALSSAGDGVGVVLGRYKFNAAAHAGVLVADTNDGYLLGIPPRVFNFDGQRVIFGALYGGPADFYGVVNGFGGVTLATFADAAAPNNSVFFGSDHPDGSANPKLCRKQGGVVVVIG